jgi:cytochrome c oxidase assembly protein subunit 15
VERFVNRLAVAATVGMFVVLLMGAAVTNTGSGEGCGRSWPLCHGEFIPAYAFETMVEYSHRAVTGVEGILIAAVAVGAWRRRTRRPELRTLVPVMVLTLLLQAGMGAWAVRSPQTPAVLASHFGISLVCFAAVFLTMRVLREGDHGAALATRPVPVSYRWLTFGALVAATGTAYLGAYMRHSGSELACHTWPLCNGQVWPRFDDGVAAAFGHRLAALGTALLIAGLAVWAFRFQDRRPDLARLAGWSLAFVLLQAASGGAVVLSRLDLAFTLSHAALMAMLFVCLADGCRRAMPPSAEEARSRRTAPSVVAPAAR